METQNLPVVAFEQIVLKGDGRKIKIAFLGTAYNKSNPSPPTLRMSYDDNPLNRQ